MCFRQSLKTIKNESERKWEAEKYINAWNPNQWLKVGVRDGASLKQPPKDKMERSSKLLGHFEPNDQLIKQPIKCCLIGFLRYLKLIFECLNKYYSYRFWYYPRLSNSSIIIIFFFSPPHLSHAIGFLKIYRSEFDLNLSFIT